MVWFKRKLEGIQTSTKDKKETPEGLWYKCPKCQTVVTTEDHILNFFVCERCSFHERVGSEEYFQLFFDDAKYKEIDKKLKSGDPLEFEDTKKYVDRIKQTQKKSGLTDAIRTAYGKIDGQDFVIAAMDFSFIGGSLGSVMGEKIARAIDKAIKLNAPFMIISKSGGARMMEAGLSLMQMAKVSAKLNQLSEAKLPYISFLTDPTTGGVTASFAMLGDINIAEPDALIAFAGPRVVKETIGRELPSGFQRSEFVLEHGFLDYIVDRQNLRAEVSKSVRMFMN
ncbi:acetyl-CoA carboxylase, carboxyltransferase subunit beta [Brumimicrobium oceani]|uniref:Acetyl-coenzyme A carboxylase carboxyl transferase subunit beta n=1 Tax=Brumimicrobium oceani TaxID=2100725 RepID=A0A2U2XCK6_9FLAO|nr:acetyl-CoA carboxylase, carboxyltransferase subunit beta [Brumimicrobium oceani]PWH85497.1 acetyl-CoA carboxylase carboxyl transferase subunit beta [Brumimicrobium oceani]